ncbi:hypothetical protein Q3G72_019898 [Acer saccharum]|nr:hypothetical protein Q3G72_019898 [Acer saccharum]
MEHHPEPESDATLLANMENLDWAVRMIGFCLPPTVAVALQFLKTGQSHELLLAFHFLSLAIIFSSNFLLLSKFIATKFSEIAKLLKQVEAAVTKYDGDGDAGYDKDDPCDTFEPYMKWNCNGYINRHHCQKHTNQLEQLSYFRKFRSNEFAKQEKIEGENDGERKNGRPMGVHETSQSSRIVELLPQ